MIILFYSDQCEFSKKIIEYIEKNNLKKNFNMININKLKEIPSNITVVPTIITDNIEAPLEGKKAFEYIINQKYFFHPTNNIDYWLNTGIPKPIIDEDKKAIERHNFGFANFNDETIKEPENKGNVVINKKTLALLKLKR
jgi:hypothetical protein